DHQSLSVSHRGLHDNIIKRWADVKKIVLYLYHIYHNLQKLGDDTAGLRVARGGSWYSASIAILYIPYRDAFQPEHSTQDLGFRIVAKLLP
ncbi:MAG: formylglycine-generating enzyme family protein, partial [candidate division KSB1 bacterium]|nr:formylglycine-generating enzyme family protein [candidate division KSB1 bacterium]